MTTIHDQLHERLSDLAAEAPSGGPAPGLWDRGRRLARRRRGTRLIAAATVTVLVGIGIGGWQSRSAEVAPASADAALRLPDELVEPSPWLPGTADEGPVGPLVAVVPAERRSWTGTGNGLVGVSAEGTYRFLDLPGADLETGTSEPTLSPDGRYLAYWTATQETELLGPVPDGIVVYDTVTGDVERRDLGERWGVAPEGLVWTDGRLWTYYFRYLGEERQTARRVPAATWDAATGHWEDAPFDPEMYRASAYGDDLLMEAQGRTARFSRDGAKPQRLRLGAPVETAVLGPDGAIAALLDVDGPNRVSDRPRPLAVGTVADDGSVALRRVPGVREHSVLGWRDPDTVVVQSFAEDGATPFVAVDVRTGERDVLVDHDLGPSAWGAGPVVASEAWAAPTYDAPAPPEPWDPRLLTGLAVATVLAGGVAVLVWRSRVRP